jgi:hypothetical protein
MGGCLTDIARFPQGIYNRPIMPIPNYSVLKGDPQPGQVTGFHPHFRIPVQTDAGTFYIDVNVQSFDNSGVLYAILQHFTPPDAQAVPDGVTEVPRQPAGLAVDYVREAISGAPMITRSQMVLLPTGKGKDLHDQVVTVVKSKTTRGWCSRSEARSQTQEVPPAFTTFT